MVRRREGEKEGRWEMEGGEIMEGKGEVEGMMKYGHQGKRQLMSKRWRGEGKREGGLGEEGVHWYIRDDKK